MNTLGVTHGVCPTCRRIVPAKILSLHGDVYLEKFCPEHGVSRALVRHNAEDYLRTLRYVKPAWIPQEFAGEASAECPRGCGFCTRHEQHLCMPIVEITSRCDLACPVCLVDAGDAWDMSRAELVNILDRLIAAERQIDVLNLSGGEPLVHPEFLSLVDEALSRPEIVRVSVSTNGLTLLDRPELVEQLKVRNVVVSLQFDGFNDAVYQMLRGRPLRKQKLAILELLKAGGVSTSLTMTVAAGVNEEQFGPVLDYFFGEPHVVSLMVQPLARVGRACSRQGDSLPQADRLTIPAIIELLAKAGGPRVRKEDFLPLPCSHPLCFSLAFYLVLEGGGTASVSRLVDASTCLDLLANRTIFGLDAEEHERMKDLAYELWSGPAGAAPDSEAVMQTLRGILDESACGCFDPRRTFAATERRVKSIFLHAFQDADTFDLARARRCCNAYPQPDGRLIPACVYNVLGRNKASRA